MNAQNYLSIILAIVWVVALIVSAFKTDILREAKEANDIKAPYSFSRFQLWLWTLIIVPLFILNWSFDPTNGPDFNATCLILLGISTANTLTAGIVSNFQESALESALKSQKVNLVNGVPDNDSFKFKQHLETSKHFLTDILMDDRGQFSITRFQQFIFTVTYAWIFVIYFINNKMAFPDFQSTAFVLMGISSGSYVVGKGLKK